MKCGKVTYLTRKAARKAMKCLNTVNHFNMKLTTIYYCKECSGYHLTTMPKYTRSFFKKPKK